MTQTNPFVRYRRGLNFDIEPNATTNPSGMEKARVTRNIIRVYAKPPSNCRVTSENDILIDVREIDYSSEGTTQASPAEPLSAAIMASFISAVDLYLPASSLRMTAT